MSHIMNFVNRRTTVAVLLVLPFLAGCIVKERCYSDRDCEYPATCNQDTGKCEIGCMDDDDCELDEKCADHRCVYATECISCSFPNAAATCVHGDCSMGDCEEGWHDLNGRDEDGCEYACTVSEGGVEVCDGRDNDCDGTVDEGYNLSSDPENCGRCGLVCPERPHSDPACASGRCTYTCHEGWYDNNRLPGDGCEAMECVPSEEVCDGYDNDCDCPGDTNGDTIVCGPGDVNVDEGFNKTLPETCGPFCVFCEYDHAEALCVDGSCRMGECDEDWYDIDPMVDGCEYECTKTNDGVEICDRLDNDCDGSIDEGGVCGIDCPSDMVPIGTSFCMDIYEAARFDATFDDDGSDETRIKSVANVMPWIENPMNASVLARFEAACDSVSKRLCTAAEFFTACTGPSMNTYVFGDVFDCETCNCVDTFCDDYCDAHGIPPADCNTGSNCGYYCGTGGTSLPCFHAVPTAQFPDCTNEYGHYDLCGNGWEIVLSDTDARGYEVRGGAFNCASASIRLACTFNASWADLFAGFRCCHDPL
jgi:hypothetical protein